jgi:hypothetical protein
MGTRSGAFLSRLLRMMIPRQKQANKQTFATNKHVDRDSSPSLDIHLERNFLPEFFCLQTDISYCFFPTTTKKVFLK